MPCFRLAAVPLLALALAACVTDPPPPREGIAYREARFAEIAALRQYRECRDEALSLDSQARAAANPARYLAVARLLERCESDLGPGAAGLAADERMRAYALAVQNHLKGGDIAAARGGLERFRAAFPGEDLYYADGSSFTETMALLLGLGGPGATGELAMSNVAADVKAELRRADYWRQH
ncbi:MAG: hypothetical protein RIM84_25875 [Alphaproteobacteria bacterium]